MKVNLEHDLYASAYMMEKVQSNELYAQHLYAALCNIVWNKAGEDWHCSWRHSGSVIATMRGEGDYMSWYCSGIWGDFDDPPLTWKTVAEGTVTEEVEEDLKTLGWSWRHWEKHEYLN